MKPIRSILTAGLALVLLDTTLHAEVFPIFEDTVGSPVTNTITKAAGVAKTMAISGKSTAYIGFGVGQSGIDPDSVTAARLTIFFPTVTKPGTISLHQLTSAFTETFTEPKRPTPTAAAAFGNIPLTKDLARDFFIVDVTAQVKAWLANPASDFGFAITGDATVACVIASKEGAGSGHPAILEIDAATGDGTVTAEKLAPGFTLPDSALAASAVNSTKIANGTILLEDLDSVIANSLSTFGGVLLDGSVTTAKIAAGAVGNAQLATGIDAGKITVGTLSDARLSANIPKLNSFNTFTGDLIVGSTFRAPNRAGSTGTSNIFIGSSTGAANGTGSDNTAVGASNTFSANTTGSGNTATGTFSLNNNVTGDSNTGYGQNTLRFATASNNTAIGRDALINNSTGSGNIALGAFAGNQVTTGSDNIAIGNPGAASESGVIRIGTAGTHTITSLVGNVGIGTATPAATLDVNGSVRTVNNVGIATSSGGVGFLNANTQLQINAAAPTIDRIRFTGTDFMNAGTDFNNGVAFRLGRNGFQNRQLWIADTTAAISATDAAFRITVGATRSFAEISGVSTDGTAAMNLVLNSGGGNVGIGTTTPGFKLDVSGGIRCVGAVDTSSDARYKMDIRPVTRALDTISALRGVSYEWNRAAFPDKTFPERRSLGFIAQDVEKVLPEVVSKDADGYYSVSYSEFIPVLVEATKELRAENAALKAENRALAAKMAAFDEQLTALKARLDDRPVRTVRAALERK